MITIAADSADFDDWAGLLELLQTAFASMQQRIDPPSSLHRLDAQALAQKASEEHLLLARDDALLVGCLFARATDNGYYLGKLAVADTYRNRGVARGLVDAASALARRAGQARLELQVRVELTENHALFERLGFVKYSETAHAGYARPTSYAFEKML